ncbi:TSUP family transporter [Allosaccharopolyspora coralli]|uniref:Probable membrane transporter protein n=1 Tax=Allosaccharopolyspora coralli TaxID=2665642 RepID=A0A5Q3Q3P5_9PSEU|nr:TSUP family transporter [Allosaccharopolyspora coralli]QGK69238.1 TSUP family transporter [Allosaccharopolyspora coralli]
MLTALNWPGFADVSLAALLFLCAAAFCAGAVDAIVGGGGLVQLPAMLLVLPGGEAIFSLATNKIASIAGTSAAARTYARRTPIDWHSALSMAAVALLGSLGGAVVADRLSSRTLSVIVLVALLAVGYYTLRTPDLGSIHTPRFGKRHQILVMCVGGVVLGFYDGIAGPGTGSFLVFLLVGLVGFSFVAASGTSKVVNVATNVGALVFFIPAGKVLWGLGLAMAVCNVAGSVLGAATATKRGSRWIRKVFLFVVAALVVSLAVRLVAG